MRISVFVASSVLLGVLCLDGVASAAPPPGPSAATAAAATAESERLKKQGDVEMDALRYTEALATYATAYAASPSPPILYNMGRALQALGQYPEALEKLDEFRTQATPALLSKVPGLTARIDDVRAHVTTVTVACNVEGSRVLLRETAIGATPLPGALKVNSGRAVVEVVHDGYLPHREEVDLPGGGDLRIDVTLLPTETEGTLIVRSPSQGAIVLLDGVKIGIVPIERRVAPGKHRVDLNLKGYKPAMLAAQITVGDRTLLNVPLEADTPITGRWWFWTGIGGAVVVGGIITAAALLTERNPDRGTYPPGQVSGPLVKF